MGKGKQGASKTEGVCATDAATAYKQGLKLCGEGAYGKALCVSPATNNLYFEVDSACMLLCTNHEVRRKTHADFIVTGGRHPQQRRLCCHYIVYAVLILNANNFACKSEVTAEGKHWNEKFKNSSVR